MSFYGDDKQEWYEKISGDAWATIIVFSMVLLTIILIAFMILVLG